MKNSSVPQAVGLLMNVELCHYPEALVLGPNGMEDEMGRPRQEFCKYGHQLNDANVVIIKKWGRAKDGRPLRSRECGKCREMRSRQQSQIEKLLRAQKRFSKPLDKHWQHFVVLIDRRKDLHKELWKSMEM
jgi:hypothetical protein